MTLSHLTINTGHVAHTTRGDVRDDVIDSLRPLVEAGRARIPGPIEWWLHVTQRHTGWAAYTITPTRGGERPYVSCVGCWHETASADAWGTITDRANGQTQPIPWLAVTTAGPLTLARMGPAAVGMLGDLERCLFWTLAELAETEGGNDART